jgi:Amt family ammonium transporter
LAFWLVGFGHHVWYLSESGVFGTKVLFFDFANAWDGAFFIFQAMFCSTAATIVSGAVAERMKYSSYILSHSSALGILLPHHRSLGLGKLLYGLHRLGGRQL